ncbi:hypothetical protein A0H81_02242 [Grifola frondosa]|uniref:Uncharacterized protein n=1 Tax=Grifola frondosa TaxID=5627 RepID=A0A1C7MPL1_GRIFR|nr:hypothetical protein A0H81_02242 [Grifola frondosa]
MGLVKILLYVGDDTFVTTLAEDVDPTSRSENVWISPALKHNGSDYHMRFICDNPPLTIYTADFTIADMAPYSPLHGGTIDANKSTVETVSIFTPVLTLVLPNSTVVSTLAPTTVPLRPSAVPSVISNEEDSYMAHDKNPGAVIGGTGRRTTVDLERFKFRLVFIFWPALIGITLAL